MPGFIVSFIVGIVCIGIGISNMRGNISSLHSYHTQRVKEEDRIPFGRLVGLGTIIMGGGIVIFSALGAITAYTDNGTFTFVGTAIMIACIVVGASLSFYAMKKYNKGIF